MLTTVEGVVIGERAYGEADKFIEVLTNELGIISISVKGGRKVNSKNAAASSLFSYSTFCINQRGDRYYLNSSQIQKSFYNLRLDIKALSLVSYFADILKFTIMPDTMSENILRLFLNTLYFLDKGTLDLLVMKSIFEFRLMCEIGLIPSLLGCINCKVYSSKVMHFDILSGKLYCENCFDGTEDYNIVKISETLLKALRHIALSEYDKLFSVSVSENLAKNLNSVTEKYVLGHLNRNFKTLEYYKSI